MTVTVYSTPTCGYCGKLKEWLTEKGIEYEEVDVSQDPEAMNLIIEKTGQRGVPQTDVNGTFVVGFDPDAIEAALKEE